MMEESYGVYHLTLLANSELPRNCRTLTIPLRTMDTPLHRRLFKPDFIHPDTSEEKRSWFRSVTGRQHLLFCSGLAAEACQNVTNVVSNGKWGAAALWLRRAARLLLGSAGAMTRARNFDTSFSETFSKGRECALTELPPVASSKEYVFLREAINRTEQALESAKGPTEMVASREFIDARRAFDEAARSFAGSARFDANELNTSSSARVKQLSSGEDYDRAFGVLRTQMMFIEDYHFNLACSVGVVRSDRHACDLPVEACAWLEQCNKLMLAIVGELLDPPSYRPNA